jgi:hypothetical protein
MRHKVNGIDRILTISAQRDKIGNRLGEKESSDSNCQNIFSPRKKTRKMLVFNIKITRYKIS